MQSMSDAFTIHERLLQIIESAELIIERSERVSSPNEFMLSPEKVMLFDSIVMRLQVIGEQVGKLLKENPSPLSLHPEINWKDVYGMRNFISHEYANVDEVIIYDVVKNELPTLLTAINDIWESEKSSFHKSL